MSPDALRFRGDRYDHHEAGLGLLKPSAETISDGRLPPSWQMTGSGPCPTLDHEPAPGLASGASPGVHRGAWRPMPPVPRVPPPRWLRSAQCGEVVVQAREEMGPPVRLDDPVQKLRHDSSVSSARLRSTAWADRETRTITVSFDIVLCDPTSRDVGSSPPPRLR